MTGRLRGGLAAAVGVCLLGVFAPQTAVSQPGSLGAPHTDAEREICNKPCQTKMRRLEHQVRSLQREVVSLRTEVDRLRDVEVLVELEAPPEEIPGCEVPFVVDKSGIRRYLGQCLDQVKAECLNPFIKRSDGVIGIKPECVH